MKISHHFDDATLIAYASGSLPQGMAVLVGSHLHWCKACRDRAREADAVGGSLLEEIEPVEMSGDALAQMLDCLDLPEAQRLPSTEPEVRSQKAMETGLPAPLAELLGRPLDQLQWRRIGYGVHQYDLGLEGPGATRLLRIAPGVSVPHHSHRGNELTLILRGSYSDELGRFCAGDVADVDTDVAHQPIVDTGEECICLIATDAPLKFSGLMGRLAQPFIGL
ncbi:ChrR family anti-sigma-E factor [Marinobacterium litorale]|uniref:ChrR family anti-sigma-E factor n=1 Tax=Marinobacterium litorale TaxID=404770 RepID=UPI00041A4326|nr:ChrR family anti-sigma-E factor [Marinobacterium litorale]